MEKCRGNECPEGSVESIGAVRMEYWGEPVVPRVCMKYEKCSVLERITRSVLVRVSREKR